MLFSFGTFSKIQKDNALASTVTFTLIFVNVSELWFQQTFVSRKQNSIIGKLVFKGNINSGQPKQCVCKNAW